MYLGTLMHLLALYNLKFQCFLSNEYIVISISQNIDWQIIVSVKKAQSDVDTQPPSNFIILNIKMMLLLSMHIFVSGSGILYVKLGFPLTLYLYL